MKTFIENLFVWLIYLLYGPNPKMDLGDLFRLLAVFMLLGILIVYLVHGQVKNVVRIWLGRRSQKKLARFAEGLGFQTRREVKFFKRTCVCEGTHRGRAVRFFTEHWRGNLSMVVVAAACREPAGLWLQVRPKLGWMLSALLNYATYRPQDFRSNDFRLRAFPLGDPSFDEAYAVKSNQPARAGELVTRKIQDELMTVRRPFHHTPIVTVAEGEARYAVPLGFFSAAAAGRLAEKMDFVCDLAEAAEKLWLKNSPALAG